MSKKISGYILLLVCFYCQPAFSYDLSGDSSTRINFSYGFLSMKEYNAFAVLNKIQKINSASAVSGDLIFNMTRDFAFSLRGEFISGIPSDENAEMTASFALTPLLFGAVYRSAPVEYLSIVSAVYLGYAWGNWEYKKKGETVSAIASGGCFTGEGDLNVLWRMPFEERVSIGVNAGLRYANLLSMKYTAYSDGLASTPISGSAVLNGDGKDLNFDMSGYNLGLSFIYDF